MCSFAQLPTGTVGAEVTDDVTHDDVGIVDAETVGAPEVVIRRVGRLRGEVRHNASDQTESTIAPAAATVIQASSDMTARVDAASKAAGAAIGHTLHSPVPAECVQGAGTAAVVPDRRSRSVDCVRPRSSLVSS